MKESSETISDETSLQRQAYLRKARHLLDDLSQKIEELAKRLKHGDGHRFLGLQDKMEDLRKKQRASLTRLEEIRAAPAGTWKHMKAGADMALVILAESYEKIVSKVTRSVP